MKLNIDLDLEANFRISNAGEQVLENARNGVIPRFDATVYIYIRGTGSGEWNDDTNSILLQSHNITLGVNSNYQKTFNIKESLSYNLYSEDEDYELSFQIVPQDFADNTTFNFFRNYDLSSIASTELFDVKINGTLEWVSHEKIPPKNTFEYKDLVPDISQAEFIKTIANLFNLRFEFSENNNHITWYTYDEYYMKYSIVKDWSNKLKNSEINKMIGSSIQANKYLFEYKESDGYLKKLYNTENLHQYGNKELNGINNTNEIEEKKIKIDLSLQEYEIYNNIIPIINNSVSDPDIIRTYPYSTATPIGTVKENPYLSYMNIAVLPTPIIFRNTLGRKITLSSVPTSSPLLQLKNETANGSVNTLEFLEQDKEFSVLKPPTLNHYESYFKNDWDCFIMNNAEYLKIKIHLNTSEYTDIKLNDIITINGDAYRIDSINNFNKNKLTDIILIKIFFNPNYTGTVVNPTQFIQITDRNLAVPYTVTNNATYTSPTDSFDFKYDYLTDAINIVNNDADSSFQISLNSTTWYNLNESDSINIRTAGSLVNGETITIYYRLYNVTTTTSLVLHSVKWDIISGDVVESLGLQGAVVKTAINVGHATVITPNSRALEINSSASRVQDSLLQSIDIT